MPRREQRLLPRRHAPRHPCGVVALVGDIPVVGLADASVAGPTNTSFAGPGPVTTSLTEPPTAGVTGRRGAVAVPADASPAHTKHPASSPIAPAPPSPDEQPRLNPRAVRSRPTVPRPARGAARIPFPP